MKTELKTEIINTEFGQTADSILRKCVHCGFCLATCPSYQVLGDERDSPRGRIYLIKSLLEGDVEQSIVQNHLDRCLTCRACETTCPSGVEYNQLLDIGRSQLNSTESLSFFRRCYRDLLRRFLTNRFIFEISVFVARTFNFILPNTLKKKLIINSEYKPSQKKSDTPKHTKVIIARGCVQPSLAPNTNLMTKDILSDLGIEAVELSNENCCGAINYHLSATEQAKQQMKQNIDVWWPFINDVEAIISTASGCGVMLKDYASILKNDPEYFDKAQQISNKIFDVSEFLINKIQSNKNFKRKYQTVAFQNPCTLQHGQKITGVVEQVLDKLGYKILPIRDSHLCCGSAGTYSILQPKISSELKSRKIKSIEKVKPDVIVTANIGCQLHLKAATEIPVLHWVELLK